MTIDERIMFLVQSTESLHSSLQELHATVAAQAGDIKEIKEMALAHNKALAIDAENIRTLARIAEAHENRISDLEGEDKA